jgi:23S rRNA pseudouridine2604 synthase
MCEHLGYEVTKLKRTRIMHIALDGLTTGDWRELEPEEIEALQELVRGSSKTQEASRQGPKRPKVSPRPRPRPAGGRRGGGRSRGRSGR